MLSIIRSIEHRLDPTLRSSGAIDRSLA